MLSDSARGRTLLVRVAVAQKKSILYATAVHTILSNQIMYTGDHFSARLAVSKKVFSCRNVKNAICFMNPNFNLTENCKICLKIQKLVQLVIVKNKHKIRKKKKYHIKKELKSLYNRIKTLETIQELMTNLITEIMRIQTDNCKADQSINQDTTINPLLRPLLIKMQANRTPLVTTAMSVVN